MRDVRPVSDERRPGVADALAALREHEDATASLVAPVAPPSAPVAPSKSGNAGAVAAAGGVLGAIAVVDQILREHGQTLGKLTVTQGPFVGGLVANLWVILVLAGVWQWAAGRWREHQARQDARWAELSAREDARAHRQDHLARAQIRATKAIADEIEHMRRDLGAEREARGRLAADVDGLRTEVHGVLVDVRDLQRRVPPRAA